MNDHRAPWLTFRRRRYLYRLGVAVVALLVAYGFITDQHALAIVAVFAPLLGLADVNATDQHRPPF